MNIVRLYNQNRKVIWRAILIIASIIILIQLLNYWSENKVKKQMEAQQKLVDNSPLDTNSTANYDTNASKINNNAVIRGGTLNPKQTKENIEIISKFIDCCNSGDVSSAYDLLSEECKEALFSTESDFKRSYYNNIFTEKKEYSIEAWDLGRVDLYRVKLMENILATGNANSLSVEEYFNVVDENDKLKLNVGGFLYRKDIKKKKTINNVAFYVDYVDIYKEYSVYNISVENNNDYDQIIDTQESSKSIYITDGKGVNSYALSHENAKEDFVIKRNSKNNFKIRFSNTFISSRDFYTLTFSDVVFNGEKESVGIEI